MRAASLCSIAVGVAFATPAFAAPKWKPHPITVIPGVPMKPADIKPYEPPKLPPEAPLEPSDVKVIEITVPEVTITVRPFSSPMVGNAVEGARLPVRGQVTSRGGGCASKTWYAVEPVGYVCARQAKPTDEPATTEAVVRPLPGERLPFHYVMVLVKEGDKIPMWATLEDLKRGAEPERQLEKGDTIAVDKPYKWEDQQYWISVEGKVLPQKGTGQMGGGSEWHGVAIEDGLEKLFGWVTPDTLGVYETPPPAGAKTPKAPLTIARRARVEIAEEQTVGKKRWLRVTATPPAADAAGQPSTVTGWVSADGVNEVRKLERPSTVSASADKWIDVDLGEQVLVAYENDKPVFATLISSGRAIATPMGTYPVWAKASAITMKNQPYEDKGYFVNKVPWSTFFQWHNAIHGAYWHDRFGVPKSHGCVNVSPLDAKHIFDWVTPAMPPGWSGWRPLDLLSSPTVVVRNSKAKSQFRQDRPIGPPDRELETQRLADAETRRASEAAAAEAAASAPPAADATTPPPALTP
jgi:lipoprotein-anchoring transpeptidase ErfK/SrfK